MLINNVNPKTGKPMVPSLTALLSISKAMGISLDELIDAVDDLDVDISAAKNLPVTENSNGRLNEFIDLFSQLTDEQQSLVISQIKDECPDKTIWCFSGYTYEFITEYMCPKLPYTSKILSNLDVLVD